MFGDPNQNPWAQQQQAYGPWGHINNMVNALGRGYFNALNRHPTAQPGAQTTPQQAQVTPPPSGPSAAAAAPQGAPGAAPPTPSPNMQTWAGMTPQQWMTLANNAQGFNPINTLGSMVQSGARMPSDPFGNVKSMFEGAQNLNPMSWATGLFSNIGSQLTKGFGG